MLLLRLPSFRALSLETFLVFNDVRLHHVRGKTGLYYFKRVKKATLPNDVQNSLSHLCLSQNLQKCDSLASQIEAFDSCLNLPEEEVSQRQVVCETLSKAMKAHFPKSSIVLMGSSVTGLGMKGCDVDLSFQFDSCKGNQSDSSFSSEVVLSKDIEAGKVPASVIPFLPSKQQLRFIRKALSECGLIDICSPIVPGKCPILNFSYSNLTCDLAINNIPAQHGTLFMLLCNKLDKRVAPLFRIISYWGKRSKLVGGPSKFKSYGIFLLVVYFLQTRMPPILPPVQIMLEKTEMLKNTDSWSFDISKYLEHFDASKNSQSLEELLKEFFSFYGNFDFSTVISPFSSQLIDMSLFCTPAESEDAFIVNSLSIQDPLDLSWNVTSGVSWKYCRLFKKGLLSACISYHEDQFKPSTDKTWGLLSLFDALKENDATMTKNKYVVFKVPLCIPTEEISKVQEQYLKVAARNIMKVFQYCLNFDCTKLEIFDPEVNISSPSTSLLSCFQCETSPTWLNRSNFYKYSLNKSELDSLEHEHNISLIMSKDRSNPGEDENINFQFICECSSVYESENINVLVHLESLSSEVFNPKLALFLKDYVPKHYVKMFNR